jgi:hypothetical protein
MTEKPGDIERHSKYLLKVRREEVRKRLAFFRLKEDVMEVLPIICISDRISDKYAKWRRYIHPLDPISLDDLKNWFGTPNEIARRQLIETRTIAAGGRLVGPVTRVTDPALPMKRGFDFRKLDQVEQVAVRKLAVNLLHGYVDPEAAKAPHVASVVDYMLNRAKTTKVGIFIAPDLIVCPDDEIVFEGLPALYFNNILVYGGGQITTRSDAKFHAQQIRHVDA